MGTYANEQSRKIDPWFCAVCSLESGKVKSVTLDLESYPNIRHLNIMEIDSSSLARVYVRASSAKEARRIALQQFSEYLQLKELDRGGSKAA